MNDSLEFYGATRRVTTHRRRVAVQDCSTRFDHRLTLERGHTRGHFVKHHTNAEEIASAVQVPTLHLFWRHITKRSYQHPRRRVNGGRQESRLVSLCGLHQRRQSKVENLDVIIGPD